TGAIASREAPTVLAIADKFEWIEDRVFLLHESRLLAVREVVASAVAHEGITDAAEVDPQVRQVVREQRPRVEQFAPVDVFPGVCSTISDVTLPGKRVRWRAEAEYVEQKRLIVPGPAVRDEAAL